MDRGPGSPGAPQYRRYQEALQRLIELALRTQDFAPVEAYFAKLAELPPAQLLPSVPYVKAKYYYFRGRRDEAASAFEQIGTTSPYYFQARYFLATIRVHGQDLAGAIPIFENLLTLPAKTDEDRNIQELTHLALGRLHYERGAFEKAIDEYQKVPRTSPLFADMLYEVAWTFIKNKEYQKAFRALDLLMLAAPDSPQAPEVKVLMGNLHVRLGNLGLALDIFEKARDEFEPVKKQLEAVLAQHGDSEAYFNELIGKNLERFEIAVYLPPTAVKWVRAEPDVEQVIQVVGDVSDMKRTVKESDDLIARLEHAVNSPARVNIFPDLASARERSLMLANILLDARTRVARKRRDMIAPLLSAGDRARLEQLGGERLRLEQRLAGLPTSADGYEARTRKARSHMEQLDHEASELNVLIQNMNAELVAAEKYYQDTQSKQHTSAAEFQKQAGEARASIDALRQMHDQLRNDIQAARETTGVGDEQVQAEEQAKPRLREVLAQERALLDRAQSEVPGEGRMKLMQMSTIIDHASQIEEQLAAFDARVDQLVDERLVDVKAAIAAEKGHMGEYRTKVDGYQTESQEVGGAITYASFHKVARRFYDIVVHSDVGVIDVAWASKQMKTDSASRVKREEIREIKLLDDEFKEVLQEEK